jgi:formylglycine-generating enzyme required for sulfatase activity
MSEFKQAILAAKKQSRQKRILLTTGTVLAVIILISLLVIARASRIEVLPAEISNQAEVSAVSGIAFVINNHLYSLSAKAEIEARAPGFKAQTLELSSEDFGKVTQLVLEPLPAQLTLSTPLSDNNTSWYLDGAIAAVADRLDKMLEAGDYEITVSHPYYEEKSLSVSLQRGEKREQSISLTPLQGRLEINSIPGEANIVINGEARGKTPLTVPLEGGQYAVEVTKAGFETSLDQVEINQAEPQPDREYRLAAKSAGVTVLLSPSGGTLTLNGINVDDRGKIRVKAGQKSTLRYAKPGYFPQSETFTLSADETRQLDFSLEQEMGSVEVTADRPAAVYVDGKKAGDTPLQTSLKAVQHHIEVRAPGYRTVKQSLTPSAASAASIHAVMVPESQARLAEAPTSYKTQAGSEMLLFKPADQVRMGAARGEPGQRANEFIRSAQLTRPFYAGRHEVTNSAYSQFDKDHSGPPQLPATDVSWIEAAQYANWLSQAEGLVPVYGFNGDKLSHIQPRADGYRLLTEAEWEWLARKAGRSEQSLFVWGDSKTLPKKAANIADESVKGRVTVYVPRYDDGHAGVAPVMAMQKEKSGLFDMGGNVSEWTHDSYTLIPPDKNAVEPHALDTSLNATRVVKGANWRSGSLSELRASYRDGKTDGSDTLGFRLGRFVYGGNDNVTH